MLAPRLRNRIFELWTNFWSSGMTNPLVAIEQITYLLFLNQLEKMDKERVQQGKPSIYEGEDENGNKYETCKWDYIWKNPDYDHIRDVVFPWLRKIDYILYPASGNPDERRPPGYLEDAAFQLDRNKQAMLKRSINIINDLFGMASSANADLMGDIFEYLLSEIQTSGKNGQFRTPRHIIRLMIELLDPEKFATVMDPAAGSAGYLINSVLHLKKRATDPETLRLEWDGSPYRLNCDVDPSVLDAIDGRYFEGYDNDRTMVRIGWMNMVLHGIDRPRIYRGDSLSKHFRSQHQNYKYILANPPFTGTVDKEDLSGFLKSKGTNKSELLFVWLILNSLELDGRAAVVVPEGVLFGSTNAHKELRRTLLLENFLDAIISLPAGVFQPYTGVKTSIILLRKRNELPTDNQPQTPNVWFYEIDTDGFSLDARREPRPWDANDIWDCLVKYHEHNKPAKDLNYYQPTIYEERWQEIDDKFLQIFPELDETLSHEKGQDRSVAERFASEMQAKDIPTAPQEFTSYITETYGPYVISLFVDYVASIWQVAHDAAAEKSSVADQRRTLRGTFNKRLIDIKRIFNDTRKTLLEPEQDQNKHKLNAFGHKALKPYLKKGEDDTKNHIKVWIDEIINNLGDENIPVSHNLQTAATGRADAEWESDIYRLVRQFAKLDGYDIQLRVPGLPTKRDAPLAESKCWIAPVRVWLKNDDWELEDEDGNIVVKGSHDDNGNVRTEYIKAHMHHGRPIDTDLLESDCVEANDYNLSAARYKPFELKVTSYEPPEEIIRTLQTRESNILERLSGLLEKVEGVE